MILLDQLRPKMVEIGLKDKKSYTFISQLLSKYEENPDFGLKNLSKPQVKYLFSLHSKYCGGR